MLSLVLVLITGFGCATAPTSTHGKLAPKRAEKPPFSYEPLKVRNSCFVESVNFYDEYKRKFGDEESYWARVLQWGNSDGDMKIEAGHAVTVFVAKNKLWFYDINFGTLPIELPLDRRADITDVTPQVFTHYPKFRPLFARYREDYPQSAPPKRAEFLFYHANRDVRDATRVANALGRVRPASVFEFELKEEGKTVTAAGAAFVFGARVCLYFPRVGTHVSPALRGSHDDLRYLQYVVKRVHPSATNIRWQPGGYLLFPPSKETKR